jgi:hypothetical protein
MCLASLFRMYGREVRHVSHALEEPEYQANGLYFHVRALGPWAFAGIATIPLAIGLDAMRQLLLGAVLARPILPVATEVWLLVGAFFVYLAVAVAMLRWTEEMGKKRGTLILRHQ